jgi:hypothetical protein
MTEFTSKQRLEALYELDWQWELQDNPEFASQAGEHDVVHAPGMEVLSIYLIMYLSNYLFIYLYIYSYSFNH